jgi:hypothetical protein
LEEWDSAQDCGSACERSDEAEKKVNKKRSRVTELFGKEVTYELVNIDKTNVVYDTYDVAAFSLSPDENDKKYDAFRHLKK